MIYDCFLFSNELDILEIRLNELESVVDKFVLVESTVSHACKPKKLFYNENKNRFKKFHNKIIHVVVKDTPKVSLPWIVNDYQYNQISRGLVKAKLTDTILLSDVDEIPKAERIKQWQNKPGSHKMFQQKISLFYLDNQEYSRPDWTGTHMFKKKDLNKFQTLWIAKFSMPNTLVPDAGWHLTYIGDIKTIQNKIASMTHQEYNNSRYNTKEKIEIALISGRDPFDLGWKFKKVSLEKLPKYVEENPEKFRKLLLPEKYINKNTPLNIKKLELEHLVRVNFLRKLKR